MQLDVVGDERLKAGAADGDGVGAGGDAVELEDTGAVAGGVAGVPGAGVGEHDAGTGDACAVGVDDDAVHGAAGGLGPGGDGQQEGQRGQQRGMKKESAEECFHRRITVSFGAAGELGPASESRSNGSETGLDKARRSESHCGLEGVTTRVTWAVLVQVTEVAPAGVTTQPAGRGFRVVGVG